MNLNITPRHTIYIFHFSQCIHCLSVLLRAQEAATWSNSSTMQVLDVILSFTIHYKPKLRKSAQHGICAILNGSTNLNKEIIQINWTIFDKL